MRLHFIQKWKITGTVYLFQTLFWWANFRWSLFLEELIIGGNFAFQNGLGLGIKTASNTKILQAELKDGLDFHEKTNGGLAATLSQ